MAQTATAQHTFQVGEDDAGTGTMHWLSAALAGLVLPAAAVLMLFPALVQRAAFAITALLLAAIIVAVLAFTLSVLLPGPVTGLVADRSSGTLELIHHGAFATKRKHIDFEDIRRVTFSQGHDRDGYSADVAMLECHDGRMIELPDGMSAGDVEQLRHVLGLSRRAR